MTRKKCGKCKKLLGIDKFVRNRSRYDGLAGQCRLCHRVAVSAWAQKNKDKVAANHDAWYQKNKNKKVAYQAAYYQKNKDERAAYRQKIKDTHAARMAARRALKQEALSHLSRQEKLRIKRIYAKAQRLTEKTGISHHVDHIFPLKGICCRGKHHPDNLQILKASDNMSKSNKCPLHTHRRGRTGKAA